jgi:hypothetical protein
MAPGLSGDGGAACFEDIDCVSWGSFSGTSLPSSAGTPFSGGIQAGQSIDRFVSGGTSAGLDAADDTDNSNNDFEQEGPNPQPNNVAASGQACATGAGGGGGGGGGQGGDPNVTVTDLKAKTPGNKAVITGGIAPPDPGGKVKLTLFANGSPLRKVAKKTDTLDGNSKFKKKFTVPSDSTRCKVTVKYNGQIEAKKRFAC